MDKPPLNDLVQPNMSEEAKAVMEFAESAIRAQAERIRNLERENRELKAKIKEMEQC